MNVFLIGDINCGKSTIVDAFINEFKGNIRGFKTIRAKTDLDDFFGIYMLDICNPNQELSTKNKVGDCKEDKSLICYEDVFVTLSLNALSNYKEANLIIMDELGILENKCHEFQKKVYECLNSDINVLGVIKQRKSIFLDNIRNRSDVKIIDFSMFKNTDVLNILKEIFDS